MKQPEIKKGAVFLGTITHSGQLDFRMAQMFYAHASMERALLTSVHQTSLLASGCNHLWCKALNNRKVADLRYFVLLHSDIVPEQWFIDKLIRILEENDADLLSAIVPIKSPDGLTSTAISGPDDFTRLTRLTTKQINDPLWPETFDSVKAEYALEQLYPEFKFDNEGGNHLLVNTGCMIARMDREWCNKVFFTINDRIIQQPGGAFINQVESEDWYFSRMVSELGGKVMATRAVKVEHIGITSFKSDKVWGEVFDPQTLTLS
jgi:GT2 family glycosyltransferase